MKKIALLSLLALSAGPLAAQQINGTFDDAWETCTPYKYTEAVGTEPQGWNLANIGYKILLTVTKEMGMPTTGVSGSAVTVVNGYVGMGSIGQVAPGYITLGTPWNAAKASLAESSPITEKDGGAFGGIDFAYRPDAIRFSYKRSHGKAGSPEAEVEEGAENLSETASVVALLWKGEYSSSVGVGVKLMASPSKETMINREKDVMGMITDGVTKSDDAECIATINYAIEGDQAEWKTLTIPFNYTSDATPEKINVIFSSADYFGDREAIGAGNSLTIDNVELIYNSQLASLAYNGTAIEGFDKKNAYYTVTGEYAEGCLTAVSDGAGASVKVSYNAENRIATITVEGNDIASNPENKHEYYVMFAPETTAYASKLIMGLAGTMLPPATENVGISEINGGKAHFLLSNFAFQGMVMGDILLTDVECKEAEDGSLTLHKEQTIRVFGDAGNTLGDLPVVLNGTLKDDKLNADLSITLKGVIPISVNVYPTSTPYVDLTALTGVASQFAAVKDGLTNPNCLFYVTDATLAGDNVIVDTECQKLVLSEDAAFFAPKAFTAAEVSFDRDFAAGRVNTFVLPFTFTVPDGISVTKLNKVEGTTLTFSPVTTAEANTPYLIETNETRPFDALTNVEVAATATADVTVSGVTHHGAFDSETVTSGETTYYGWNENGEFVKATTGTLLPFRTYLTTSAAQAAPSFKVIMDKPTGIDTITTTETDGAIYDLTGRRVEKAVKGIYIRDGKKVYIK